MAIATRSKQTHHCQRAGHPDDSPARYFVRRSQTAPTIPAIGCKLGVRSTAALTTISTLDRLTNSSARGVIHLSSGIGACAIDRSSDISTLRSECEAAGGYLSVLQAPEDLKQTIDVWGYRGNGITLMRSLKQQFDPDNILNPARCF